MAKKKLIEIRGTKIQKVCILLQLIVVVVTIVCDIYCNINNITDGFFTKVNSYSMYIVIALLIIPSFFGDEK